MICRACGFSDSPKMPENESMPVPKEEKEKFVPICIRTHEDATFTNPMGYGCKTVYACPHCGTVRISTPPIVQRSEPAAAEMRVGIPLGGPKGTNVPNEGTRR